MRRRLIIFLNATENQVVVSLVCIRKHQIQKTFSVSAIAAYSRSSPCAGSHRPTFVQSQNARSHSPHFISCVAAYQSKTDIFRVLKTARLFNRHRLCKITRFVRVVSKRKRDVIGEHLQRDNREHR